MVTTATTNRLATRHQRRRPRSGKEKRPPVLEPRVKAATPHRLSRTRVHQLSRSLSRKLAEIQENYALQAVLRPLIVARVRLPALVVPVAIQRKQAIRDYRLYWNSLVKRFEPLSCSRCLRPTYSATFANETVDLLCGVCAEKNVKWCAQSTGASNISPTA